MAWLFATEKPVFSLLIISFTKGNLSLTSSIDWSTELLSTTNTSASIFFIAFGDELEYADEITLGRSIANRLPYESSINS